MSIARRTMLLVSSRTMTVRIVAIRASIVYSDGTVVRVVSMARERVLVFRSRVIRGLVSEPGNVMTTVGLWCGRSEDVEIVRWRIPGELLQLLVSVVAGRAPWKIS